MPPNAFSNLNALSSSSETITLVAFDGPLLITVIVKFTNSPTVALVKLTVLTTVRLTLGSTVTLLVFDGMSVLFSLQFTQATFENVPFVRSLTITYTLLLVPFAMCGIIQVTLLPEIVLFPGALTISNARFKLSNIVTFVALLGPLLVTLIVKVM